MVAKKNEMYFYLILNKIKMPFIVYIHIVSTMTDLYHEFETEDQAKTFIRESKKFMDK